MPKTIASNLIPYFYKKSQTVLMGYELDLDGDGTYETKYVANNQNIGSYVALAIKRGTITTEDGTSLNEIEIGLDNTSLDFKQMVIGSVLERKGIKINLLFVSNAGTLLGTVLLFWGVMDAPKGDENWVTITVRPFEMLDREYPRRIYQIGCNWRFCETNTCNLDLNDYYYTGTLASQSDGITFSIAHGFSVNYFVPGYIQITSGDYANEVRPIAVNATDNVVVRVAFGHSVPAGVSVKLQKLCAKNPYVCENIFNNYTRYGGFPHVPKQPII